MCSPPPIPCVITVILPRRHCSFETTTPYCRQRSYDGPLSMGKSCVYNNNYPSSGNLLSSAAKTFRRVRVRKTRILNTCTRSGVFRVLRSVRHRFPDTSLSSTATFPPYCTFRVPVNGLRGLSPPDLCVYPNPIGSILPFDIYSLNFPVLSVSPVYSCTRSSYGSSMTPPGFVKFSIKNTCFSLTYNSRYNLYTTRKRKQSLHYSFFLLFKTSFF